MDRELAPEIRRNRITRRVLTIAVAAAAIIFSFAATVSWLRPSIRRADIETARVERGNVDAALQASGTIVPAIEQAISSPVEARVLRIVRRPGDRVRAGDELMALDTSGAQLDFDRLSGQVSQKESEQAQMRLKLEDSIAALEAQIEQKKLDRQILGYKAEQSAKLLKAGLVSEQDDLAAATASKKADIEQTQLADALGRAKRTGEAQIAAASAELTTLRKERDESQRQLQLAMMRADRDGIITWLISDSGATIRKGDVVARIADLSSFRVDATISDLHTSELSAGMPVKVRVDQNSIVEGRISSIDPRIENGVMTFHVALDPSAAPRLRSNARVDVDVVTERRRNILRVKRGSLGAGETELVFVVRKGLLVPITVRWGLAGRDYIQPIDGLREGDEVVTSNMSDYAGVKSLRLK
jgi:HlyD family secretion protein